MSNTWPPIQLVNLFVGVSDFPSIFHVRIN